MSPDLSSNRRPSRAAESTDTSELAAGLRASVRGEVRFDAGSRALYATDASNYRQVPIGVVVPVDRDDVLAAVSVCRDHDAPVLPRGAGTSLAGQACNVAVVLDCSKHLRQILELDPERRVARVQPGVILDDLRRAAEPHGLTFGPDPATHDRCTLGGMIGNNSCGVHSVMSGTAADNVEELDVLLHEGLRLRVGKTSDAEHEQIIRAGGRQGEIYAALLSLRDRYAELIRGRYPPIPRRVSGYNLDRLLPERGFDVAAALVGTEGTCATVLEATVKLVPSPPVRRLVVLAYPDVFAACDDVPRVLEHGPIGLEGFDAGLLDMVVQRNLHPEGVRLLPEGGGWLMAEFGAGSKKEADSMAVGLVRKSGSYAPRVFADPAEAAMIWKVRESGLAAAARLPDGTERWEGWEDSAVPPERLGAYLRDLCELVGRYGYHTALYGHFGEGCLHNRMDYDLKSAGGVARFRSFVEEAADLVVSYGGSLSGEHGDGQARAELLPRMFGPELVAAFEEFKSIWDPGGRMNPGKVVHPNPLDGQLRLGPAYGPPSEATRFAFPADRGSFALAVERCVGVGVCRRDAGGVMCPSYMATHEEMHSTRGRARLLFEMLNGPAGQGPLSDGWRDPHVKEALDLCLACKACKTECPLNVDMASYKAEFLSHHYRGRIRPASAYALGLIAWWCRLAALIPRAANAAIRAPLVGAVLKRTAGVATERDVPRFAERTFRSWFARRRRPGRVQPAETPKVILWPDTFNDHFHPQTAIAAVEVLEAAGFRVVLPHRWLCCGRPLYDVGMLNLARWHLRQILDALGEEIDEGTPVVGLEPSCLAVFRDELRNLFPDDPRAGALSRQSFLLSEFLQQHASGWQPPGAAGRAIVQRHCHHQAVMGFGDEERLLRDLGLQAELLDSGCCGMAGSFGFEREKVEVSKAAGERVLLPAVRAASDDTWVLADGFSCREQIAQGTARRALHVAQVLQMFLRGERPDPGERPEDAFDRLHPAPSSSRAPQWAALGLVLAAALVWMRARRGKNR